MELRLTIPDPNETRWISFSPNEEWLAYITGVVQDGHPVTIHLLSKQGKEIASIPDQSKVLTPIEVGSPVGAWASAYWVDNDLILAHLINSTEDDSTRKLMVIVNPFTSEWQQDMFSILPNRDMFSGIAFSPDLTRALYVAEASEANRLTSLILWDMEKQDLIWEQREFEGTSLLLGRDKWNGPVAWSPDSSVVAYTGPENPQANVAPIDQQGVYLLNRQGSDARRITNFFGQYESFSTMGLSWSPNGRYPAFDVSQVKQVGSDASESIYVYDTAINRFILQCPLYGETFYSPSYQLTWSPDSRYIAYSASYYGGQGADTRQPRPLVVIDLDSGSVFQLAEFGLVVGWVNSFPWIEK